MGDSACLIHFSDPPDISHEDSERNPNPILGGSISFGRFAADSLAWEKWSSFSHNRYLEEVEKYSTPGSVAQKKAYFEAHYKRIAAERAAKLLEQANIAATNAPNSSRGDPCCVEAETELNNGSNYHDSANAGIAHFDRKYCSNESQLESGIPQFDASDHGEECNNDTHDVDSTNPGIPQFESFDHGEECHNESHLVDSTNTCIPQFESSDLGEECNDETHIVDSTNQFAESNNSVPVHKPDEAEASTVGLGFTVDADESVNEGKPYDSETKVVQGVSLTEEKIITESQSRIDLPQQVGGIENQNEVSEMEIGKSNKKEKPPLKEISNGTKKTQAVSVSKASNVYRNPKLPPASPAKPVAFIHSKKENLATPNSKRSPWDSAERKRSTPKSLHMSLNLATQRSGETPPSTTNKRALALEKIGDSKSSRDCFKSPSSIKVSSNGAKNVAVAMTSEPENRRAKTLPENPIAQIQKADRKWLSLSLDPSRSSSCSGIKASPKFLSCFNLRSEERATKRKEFFMKLEERSSFKEAEKAQLQEKSKEQAKLELKKLRQSLGFKAKPMPDFYRETEPAKNQIKKQQIPLTRPRSPKLGRKTNSSTVPDPKSLPPPRPPVRSDGLKNSAHKNRTPDHSLTSFPTQNARKINLPNAQ